MRVPVRDPGQYMNQPEKPARSGGCLSTLIFAFGFMTILLSAMGYILGLFGNVIKVYNSKMPLVDLPMFLVLLEIGIVSLGIGWVINKIEDSIRKRKNKNS